MSTVTLIATNTKVGCIQNVSGQYERLNPPEPIYVGNISGELFRGFAEFFEGNNSELQPNPSSMAMRIHCTGKTGTPSEQENIFANVTLLSIMLGGGTVLDASDEEIYVGAGTMTVVAQIPYATTSPQDIVTVQLGTDAISLFNEILNVGQGSYFSVGLSLNSNQFNTSMLFGGDTGPVGGIELIVTYADPEPPPTEESAIQVTIKSHETIPLTLRV